MVYEFIPILARHMLSSTLTILHFELKGCKLLVRINETEIKKKNRDEFTRTITDRYIDGIDQTFWLPTAHADIEF